MTENLKQTGPFKQGYLAAVRLLTASKKSSQQVFKLLRDKGYTEEIAGCVVEELQRQHILNDQALVRDTVHWATEAKRYGRNRIWSELKKRGIQESAIRQVIDDYPKEREIEVARDLAAQRWARLEKLTPEKRKQRLYHFLIGRGFGYDIARELIIQLEHEHS